MATLGPGLSEIDKITSNEAVGSEIAQHAPGFTPSYARASGSASSYSSASSASPSSASSSCSEPIPVDTEALIEYMLDTKNRKKPG